MTLQSTLTACCLMLIGVGMLLIPDAAAENVRGAVNDLLRPGHQAVRLVVSATQARWSDAAVQAAVAKMGEADELANLLAEQQERTRALEIRLAQLSEQTLATRQISTTISKAPRLVVPSLVEVAVLGDTVAEQWRAGKVLDQGTKNGVREHEYVLTVPKLHKLQLIDLGEDVDISTEDALLLGRCVIGKVEHVGRWTSTFQLVTDSEYRGRAQLIRENPEGLFVFEAQGILKGRGGPLCQLEGIPAESSVHVHDAVYTADRDGILPTPLYYGEVVEATLGADDREWTVLVKPAPVPSHLTTVQVLRSSLNKERLVSK